MTWTKVAKPERGISNGQPIAAGFFLYLTYATAVDDWNDVAKPTGDTWVDVPKPTGNVNENIFAGEPIGLLLALTYAEDSSFTSQEWTNVPKPTT